MKKIKLLILVSVLFNPMVVLSQMTPREIYQKNVNSVVLFITKNKDKFKSKYGDNWKEVLYSTAWNMHKKHWKDKE